MTTTIINPKLKDTILLNQDQFDSLARVFACCKCPKSLTLKDSKTIEIAEDLGTLTYRKFIDLKTFFSQATEGIDIIAEPIEIVTGMIKEEVLELNLSKAFPLWKHIENELLRLSKIEAEQLDYTPSPEEEQADFSKLSKFGELARIHSLANGDLLKFEKVLELPYNDVLATLLYEKETREYQERLNEIASKTTT